MSFRDDVMAPAPLAADRVQQMYARLRGIRQIVGSWIRRRNDRAFLRSLSPRDLHDFCPRQSEADAEINKPFWQP